MSHSTTPPSDGQALMRALHDHLLRQEREARVARYRHRILAASGIDPDQLSEQGKRIFRWLADDWDEWTIGGLVEILRATHTAGGVALREETTARTIESLEEAMASAAAELARRKREERR